MTGNMDKAVALLPCPFCGDAMQPRDALWPSEGDVDGIIHAKPTDCPMPEFTVGTADSGVSVAAAWNTRAALPHLGAQREEIAREVCTLIERLAHCDTRWPATARIEPDKALEFADAILRLPTVQGQACDDQDRMVKISKLIADMQEVLRKFGDTCVYIRRGGLSWGAVALNQRDDDKQHGVFDLQAQHDRDMLARLEQIERLKSSRDEWMRKAGALPPSPPAEGE